MSSSDSLFDTYISKQHALWTSSSSAGLSQAAAALVLDFDNTFILKNASGDLIDQGTRDLSYLINDLFGGIERLLALIVSLRTLKRKFGCHLYFCSGNSKLNIETLLETIKERGFDLDPSDFVIVGSMPVGMKYEFINRLLSFPTNEPRKQVLFLDDNPLNFNQVDPVVTMVLVDEPDKGMTMKQINSLVSHFQGNATASNHAAAAAAAASHISCDVCNVPPETTLKRSCLDCGAPVYCSLECYLTDLQTHVCAK